MSQDILWASAPRINGYLLKQDWIAALPLVTGQVPQEMDSRMEFSREDIFKECSGDRHPWKGVEESWSGQRRKLSCAAGLLSTWLNQGSSGVTMALQSCFKLSQNGQAFYTPASSSHWIWTTANSTPREIRLDLRVHHIILNTNPKS